MLDGNIFPGTRQTAGVGFAEVVVPSLIILVGMPIINGDEKCAVSICIPGLDRGRGVRLQAALIEKTKIGLTSPA